MPYYHPHHVSHHHHHNHPQSSINQPNSNCDNSNGNHINNNFSYENCWNRTASDVVHSANYNQHYHYSKAHSHHPRTHHHYHHDYSVQNYLNESLDVTNIYSQNHRIENSHSKTCPNLVQKMSLKNIKEEPNGN